MIYNIMMKTQFDGCFVYKSDTNFDRAKRKAEDAYKFFSERDYITSYEDLWVEARDEDDNVEIMELKNGKLVRSSKKVKEEINALYNELEDSKANVEFLKNERAILEDMARNMENRLNPHIKDCRYSLDVYQSIMDNAKKLTEFTPDDINAKERNLRFVIYEIEKMIKDLKGE